MRVREVHRRYGQAARKWVWVAGPMYVFEDDGKSRADLVPVDKVLPEHYEDDNGWWTCHADTEEGDLAVIYRSGAKNAAGRLPARGPKDICQVSLATSNARRLAVDPLAGEFLDQYGCLCVVVAEFSPTIGIRTLKTDPEIMAWPALRAGFVKAASPMPEAV
jgi:hypothetical protein